MRGDGDEIEWASEAHEGLVGKQLSGNFLTGNSPHADRGERYRGEDRGGGGDRGRAKGMGYVGKELSGKCLTGNCWQVDRGEQYRGAGGGFREVTNAKRKQRIEWGKGLRGISGQARRMRGTLHGAPEL